MRGERWRCTGEEVGPWGTAPWVKAPAAKPGDQSSIPGIHMVDKEN